MSETTEIRRCVTILKPRAEVYEALREPQVWGDLLDASRMEGQLVVDEVVPEERLRWHASAPSEVPHSGTLTLADAPAGRGTEVTVSVAYEAHGGKVGELLRRLKGEEPKQLVSRHLYRLRQLLEAGEIATTEGQPSGRDETDGEPASLEPARRADENEGTMAHEPPEPRP